MPKAVDVLAQKQADGRPAQVISVSPLATVAEAAKRMNDNRIGALVVVDDSTGLVGMFTERDVLTRVVAVEKHPEETRVGDVMSSPVAVCSPQTPLTEIQSLMRQKRIRHLPVVEGSQIVGMISIGDLNASEAKVMHETINYLEQYMYRP